MLKWFANQLSIAFVTPFFWLTTTHLVWAQISADNTLLTEVLLSNDGTLIISGGTRVGDNLFHSFEEFSIPPRRTARFNNDEGIVNILSRVTGSNISSIGGRLQAQGNASFFLINPNGIIFGPEASLDIGGSFIASTARSIQFVDGTVFSSDMSQAQPMLTINTPYGLQFGETANEIVNQSGAISSNSSLPVGLEVLPGRTLALVGGNLVVGSEEGVGLLTAPGGRIELGSVSADSLVRLIPISSGWTLGYEGIQNFQDIHLFQATVDTSAGLNIGRSSGAIQFQGRQVVVADNSVVQAFTSGPEPGESIIVNASESIEIFGGGFLTFTLSDGAAGNIVFETDQFRISDGGSVNTITAGTGRGGDLTINARDSIELSENGILTSSSVAFDSGNAGTIRLETENLSLRQGGLISTSTLGEGDAGNLIVNASESVLVEGQALFSSGFLTQAQSFLRDDTGNGGDLEIETGQLIVRDGGRISVSTFTEGTGGQLTINANALELSGTSDKDDMPSGLFTFTEGVGNAGRLRVEADQLIVHNGARISAEATNTEGNAGNLLIQARQLNIQDRGQITAENISSASQGIQFQNVDRLVVSGGGQITASTQTGQAGSVSINANEAPASLVQVSGNDSLLAARATDEEGIARNVTINTNNLTLQDGAQIAATNISGMSRGVQLEGVDNLMVSGGSQVTASTQTGQAGSVSINTSEAPASLVQVSGNDSLLAAQATGERGIANNVTINTRQLTLLDGGQISAANVSGISQDIQLQGIDTLIVGGGSQITASTQTGRAGNVSVNAGEVAADSVQVSGDGSLIAVEATGATLPESNISSALQSSVDNNERSTRRGIAGNMLLNTRQLTVENRGAVTVSSDNGQAGTLTINAPTIFLDGGQLTAETAFTEPGEEGANINLRGVTFLLMQNDSLISAEASNRATGGNITINSPETADGFIIAPDSNNSDILAIADQGRGGAINVSVDQIFGFTLRDVPTGLRDNRANDISASSAGGPQGIVDLNTLDIDPRRDLGELPSAIVDASTLVAPSCEARSRTDSEFTVIGQGGIPPAQNDVLSNDSVWEDWRLTHIDETSDNAVEHWDMAIAPSDALQETRMSDRPPAEIIEAQGWMVNAEGTVALVADVSGSTPQGLGRHSWRCS